ncbi:MAG: ThuA domain-containing protein [Planctomicrobium sp.]|jgi:uncharacterized protein|nr:ThuA domain-containing protein [Planctomicrobium sp.]
MLRHFSLSLPLLLSSAALLSAAEPLKGLIITGGCCHDYENQKHIISEGLSQRLNITWDFAHEGGTGRDHKISVYSEPGWAKKYDLIVHNECFGGVTDPEFVKSIADAHFDGVPGIFIHCALHSYRNSGSADAWRELIGVTSRSHEGKRGVNVVKLEDHPVMTNFPKAWKTPNGELYKIEKEWSNCTPLAKAYGEDTKKDHTVVWLNKFGKANVFGTSLGHHNETMNNDIWLGMVARGALFVTGHLDENGNPDKGYEGSGIKPIVIGDPEPKADPKFSKKKKKEDK